MIFHLTTDDEWTAAPKQAGFRAHSLSTEGFVHCSYDEQLLETANLHFKGHDHLLVLHIDETQLGPLLKVEPSRNGQLFPHIYG